MNGKNLYAMGALVILTGVLGVVCGILFGTPGSVVIGLGLTVAATWMLKMLHDQEDTSVDKDAKRL